MPKPARREIQLLHSKTILREENILRGNLIFDENVGILQKSGIYVKFHQFDLVIYKVSWILRIRVFSPCGNSILQCDFWILWEFHENAINSQLFMNFL